LNDPADGLVDVRELIRTANIDELNQAADQYFLNIKNWDYHLSKPFLSAEEFPRVMIPYSQLIEGLNLSPGLKVVDFGAGSCWSSRLLCQMGMQVIALDVSPAALKMGEELFRRQPVFGNQPAPQFIPFDGKRIPLPDHSVDRICCFDAFHHVPNPDVMIREMGRILKSGGIAGFSEPGPNHSKEAQSQYEMKNYKVIENDVVIEDVWGAAEKAGFKDLKLAIFNSNPMHLSFEEFKEFVWHRKGGQKYVDEARSFVSNRRLFFLYKEGIAPLNSTKSRGLRAELKLELSKSSFKLGDKASLSGAIKNKGEAIWLPSLDTVGAVKLGIHLFNSENICLEVDYLHLSISDREVNPDESVSVNLEFPLPKVKGKFFLEFDLVAEGVAWFASVGSQTIRKEIQIE
jgi:ubiquinone/menaquinone biosynthesis C-methylase UbiE